MLIVDSQIHLWQNGKMSAQHRQIPTYSADDALAEMASAGVDCAVIHPPSALGEAVNVLAVEAVRQHPDKFSPRTFRSAEPGPRKDRRPLARAAGHARVSLHLQPATSRGVVDRWLDRLVLGGMREGEITNRTPGRRQHDGAGEDRRAASRSEAAHRSPRAPGWRPRRNRRRGLRRSSGHTGARQISQCRGQDVRCSELFESALPVPEHPRLCLRQVFEAFGPERSFWGTDITRMPCSYRQCVTMFTEELPWLQGRDLERVMGGAIVDWLGWKRPAAA